jgi:cell division protein FtsI/penicillin-binding protein 2
VIAGLFVLAAMSQAKLQILERSQTIDLAKRTSRYTLARTERANRGAILASDGKPFAQDDDTLHLDVDFAKVPHCDAFYMDLSHATGIPAGEFSALEDSKDPNKSWRQAINQVQANEIRKVKSDWRADGLSLAKSGRREYPMGDETSGIIGLVREGKPIMGLEASQNKILCGRDGKHIGLVDRNGQFLPMRDDAESVPVQDGKNITLTIDSDLQAEATESIRRAVESNKADDGVAIIIQPNTGKILAMAAWPSYEPYNPDGSDGDLSDNSGYNPAYMGVLEPGSTFKILTLAKGLDTGKVKMSDTVQCNGELHVDGEPQWRVRCDNHHGNRAHGTIDAEVAIAKSCNVSAATWALKIGRDDFIAYVNKLGLFDKPGVGLPRESYGLFNKHDWAQRLQLANMGFGQAMNTTPLALASAFTMIANDGVRMSPRLIDKIGDVPVPLKPGVRIVRPDTAHLVTSCMEAVIESGIGTGKSLRIPGYDLAGKTGTAQKIGKGGSKGYVSNFVGFVPAKQPKALILVMVNHPTNGNYYGASVAGPVFKDLAMSVIRRYNILPTQPVNGSGAQTGTAQTLSAGRSIPAHSAQPGSPAAR